MSESWDFYFCRVNDALASVFVDLGRRVTAPEAARPWLHCVTLPMRAPRPDGLSDKREADALAAIEEALRPALAGVGDAVLVGRITTAGRREFYYYGGEPVGATERAVQAVAAFPGYGVAVSTMHDPTWSHYLEVLYPSPREVQRIENRRAVQALEREGDPLTVPRPVTHWIYFREARAREAFAAEAASLGYVVPPDSRSEHPEQRFPFGLRIERVTVVDRSAMDDTVLELLDRLDPYDAKYDGWETEVVRPRPRSLLGRLVERVT